MTHSLADSPALPRAASEARPVSRRRPPSHPAAPHEHWLSSELIERSNQRSQHVLLSPYVIDVDRELDFWRSHYQLTAAWHRGVLPFIEYIPAFHLGISLFLQCHDYTLAALSDDRLALRYARARHDSRVEWHEACQALHAAYLRLQRRWQESTGLSATEEAHRRTPPSVAEATRRRRPSSWGS